MAPSWLKNGKRCIRIPYFSNKNVKIKMPDGKMERFGRPGRNVVQWIRDNRFRLE